MYSQNIYCALKKVDMYENRQNFRAVAKLAKFGGLVKLMPGLVEVFCQIGRGLFRHNFEPFAENLPR